MSSQQIRYWLCPRDLILKFQSIISSSYMFISKVLEHDQKHYLVETTGNYPYLINKLYCELPIIKKLNEIDDEDE